ncbi:MAG: metal-sulfur cluster assembly factor [Alkalispirochaetaceae bacterium]
MSNENMPSKGDVLESLKKVIDPEIGYNIVEVGLVYRIDVTEEAIEVDFTLTSPGCPLADTIYQDITNVIREDHDVEAVEANLVWSPPWNPDFMSEDVKLALGFPI